MWLLSKDNLFDGVLNVHSLLQVFRAMAAGQVREEDLIGAFQAINEDIADRKDILDKCK